LLTKALADQTLDAIAIHRPFHLSFGHGHSQSRVIPQMMGARQQGQIPVTLFDGLLKNTVKVLCSEQPV